MTDEKVPSSGSDTGGVRGEQGPCIACEGEQFDGFICDRCGRGHHVAADGTWWSTWPLAAPPVGSPEGAEALREKLGIVNE